METQNGQLLVADLDEIRELLDESYDVTKDKRKESAEMNSLAKATAKQHKTWISKKDLMKIKDIIHYKERGWVNGGPLEKDPDVDYPDKVSPIFIKLLESFMALNRVGKVDELNPYIDAMIPYGINISVNQDSLDTHAPKMNKEVEINDVMNTVKQMGRHQAKICELSDIISKEDAQQAEDANWIPKGEYKKVYDLYEKIRDAKNSKNEDSAADKVDDKYQDQMLKMTQVERAWTQVYNKELL